ncbi:hypothetical protein OUZ56_003555 [Daphnia magna]|uniref:Uncharacterized protein n=1 Tax=Daphnia magna TaxID=35525 RepID=A0ABR0A9A9_9CRUS|nr:hypothetical protein OUZ56_003555 [Daphnia magna]
MYAHALPPRSCAPGSPKGVHFFIQIIKLGLSNAIPILVHPAATACRPTQRSSCHRGGKSFALSDCTLPETCIHHLMRLLSCSNKLYA